MSKTYILPFIRQGLSQYIVEVDNLSGEAGGGQYASISADIKWKGEIVELPKDSEEEATDSLSSDFSHSQKFKLIGPSEVESIQSSAIRQVVPPQGGAAMSYEFMPYIEFHDADFPWRYTPLKENGEKIRPWISLIVCKEGEYELLLQPSGKYLLNIKAEMIKTLLPDIKDLPLLSHVQQERESEKVLGEFSRTLCSRKLEIETEYTAFLIPTFKQGLREKDERKSSIQESAWNYNNPSEVTFPIYHQWKFKTGDASFRTLARRIESIDDNDYFKLNDTLKIDISDTGISHIEAPVALLNDIEVERPKNPRLPLLETKHPINDNRRTNSKLRGLNIPKSTKNVIIEPLKDINVTTSRKPNTSLVDFLKNKKGENYGIIPIGVALKKRGNSLEETPDSATKTLLKDQQASLKELLKLSPVFTKNHSDITGNDSLMYDEDPWIVPPVYGARHLLSTKDKLNKKVGQDNIIHDLNIDFENRIAAGMGASAVQENQESFVHRAWVQIESVKQQNQIIKEFFAINQLNTISEKRVSPHFYKGLDANLFGLKSDAAMKIAARSKQTSTLFKALENGEKNESIYSGYQIKDSSLTQGVYTDELKKLFDFSTWRDFLDENSKSLKVAEMIVPRSRIVSSFFKADIIVEELNNGEKSYHDISEYPDRVATFSFDMANFKSYENSQNKDIFKPNQNMNNVIPAYANNKVCYLRVGDKEEAGIILPSIEYNKLYSENNSVSGIKYKNGESEEIFYIFNGGDLDYLQSLSTSTIKLKYRWWYLREIQSREYSVSKTENIKNVHFIGGSKSKSNYIEDFKIGLEKLALNPIIPPSQEVTQTSDSDTDNINFADKIADDRILKIYQEFFPGRDLDDIMTRLWETAYSKHPIMAYPEFPDPTVFYLRKLSERFVLPSVNSIKQNTISCFISNPKFEEAFLCGMNTEMGKELLWREYPTDERGSYFRKFWDTFNLPKSFDDNYFDIEEVHNWKNKLGENHRKNKLGENHKSGKSQLLTFAIRSELMHAYPQTNVFISSYNGSKFNLNNILEPEMTVWLTDDIFLVGFPEAEVTKFISKNKNSCLTFEEERSGMRFYLDPKHKSSPPVSAAAYAELRKTDLCIHGYKLEDIPNITN